MKIFTIALSSLLLRGVTLLLKFVLTIALAKYLSVEELGQFGLVLAINALAGYLIGLDFYQFSTREILGVSSERYSKLIRDQFALHFLSSLAVLPVIFFVVTMYFLPQNIAILAIAIVMLEQINQEIFRLLVTLSRPVAASFVYFIRQGFWILLACFWLWSNSDGRSLELVLEFWIIGATVSLLVSCYYFSDLDWRDAFNSKIDWSWIWKGITTSMVLLASTILINSSIYLSRFFLSIYHYEEEVGLLTFFWNIANVIQVLTFTGIIMVIYPKLISAYQHGDMNLYKSLYRKMTFACLVALIFLVVIALFLIDPVVSLVDQPQYRVGTDIFSWLLLAAVFYCLAQVASYSLYVRHLDYQNLITAVVAFLTCLVGNRLLVPDFGLHGAAWATFIGAFTLISMKLLIITSVGRMSQPTTL